MDYKGKIALRSRKADPLLQQLIWCNNTLIAQRPANMNALFQRIVEENPHLNIRPQKIVVDSDTTYHLE